MRYKQIHSFSLSRMGTQRGLCLQNCRLGFGIGTPKANSAKDDMNWQKANGYFHAGTFDIPANCAVPVYCDTPSQYEHVVVSDHGKVYSDGKLSSLSNYKVFGWGEFCDKTRVVAPDGPDRTFTFDIKYCDGFLPVNGYWRPGDKHAHIAVLSKWLADSYPLYVSKEARGDYYGPKLRDAVMQWQKRARVSKKYSGAVDGNVGPLTYAAMRSYGFRYQMEVPKPTPPPIPEPEPEPEPKPEPKPVEPEKPAAKPEEPKPTPTPTPEEKPQEEPVVKPEKPKDEEYKGDLALAEAQATIIKLTKTIELMKEAQKKHHLPSLIMPSKVYDFLKFMATTGLPAFNTLYIGLASIWGFGFGPEVDSTIQLSIAFINAILGAVVIKASSDYKKLS